MATARKTNAKPSEWLTIDEAADLLSMHRQTVLGRAVRGDLTTQVIGRRTFVSRESVEQLLGQES